MDMGKELTELSHKWAVMVYEYDLDDPARVGGDVMDSFRGEVSNGTITKKHLYWLTRLSIRALALSRERIGVEEFDKMLMDDAKNRPEMN